MDSPRPTGPHGASATAVFEYHHGGFRMTVRGRGGYQICHEVGLTGRAVVELARAWNVEHVEILPAQD